MISILLLCLTKTTEKHFKWLEVRNNYIELWVYLYISPPSNPGWIGGSDIPENKTTADDASSGGIEFHEHACISILQMQYLYNGFRHPAHRISRRHANYK